MGSSYTNRLDAGPLLMNGWRVGTLSNNGASSNYERKWSLTEAADDEHCGREWFKRHGKDSLFNSLWVAFALGQLSPTKSNLS